MFSSSMEEMVSGWLVYVLARVLEAAGEEAAGETAGVGAAGEVVAGGPSPAASPRGGAVKPCERACWARWRLARLLLPMMRCADNC